MLMTETEFLTCELQGLSIEDIFRKIIKTDGEGNFWLNTNLYQQRAEIELVLAAGTPILFSKPMPNANWVMPSPRCYNALNENLEVVITNKTVDGFTATPFENGTLEYFVTEQI